MTNVYSLDGLMVFGLLLICTCAYMSRVPKLKQWLLSEKKGFLGVFYKEAASVAKGREDEQPRVEAAVIGTRLHFLVAMSCICMAIYVMLIK